MKKLGLLLATGALSMGVLVGCGQAETKKDTTEVTTAAGEASIANDNSAIVGEWTLTQIKTADGKEYTLAEYCQEQGVDTQGVEVTYSFKDDGSVTGAIGGIGVEGTYTVDANNVTATFPGKDAEGNENTSSTVMVLDEEAGTLTAEDANSGMTSIMQKQ